MQNNNGNLSHHHGVRGTLEDSLLPQDQAAAAGIPVPAARDGGADTTAALVGALRIEQEGDRVDPTMRLSRIEKERALTIKMAVQADDRIDDTQLSDFIYCQWALTTNIDDSLESICERVYLMQCFMREYNLKDTASEGVRLLTKYTVDLLPGNLLSFNYLGDARGGRGGGYMVVQDIGRFCPGGIRTHNDYTVMLGAVFYLYQAVYPNFTAMRSGARFVWECMDSSFANFDQQVVVDKLIHQLYINYPMNQSNYYVNSPTMINIAYGIIKRFLPQRERKRFHLGYQGLGTVGMEDGQRLDAVFNIPTPEAARERNLHQIEGALHLRYMNQAGFVLSINNQNNGE